MSLGYLDPGSGSLIVQALVAGAAGVAVVLKLGWRRITGVFRSKPAAKPAGQPAENPAEQEAGQGA